MLKFIEYFKNITTERIFILLFGIWILDMLTTIFALTGNNIIETNAIANFFFSMGIKGWFLFIFIVGFFLLGVSYSLEKLNKKISFLANSWVVVFASILTFYIGECFVIIKNIINIIEVIL
jgi:hypothetical protein